MTTTTSLDLLSILMEHNSWHQRLKDGEFGELGSSADNFDEELATKSLLPLIEAIGVQGLADLLHIVQEMFVEVIRAANEGPREGFEFTAADRKAAESLTSRGMQFMDWFGIALFAGALPGVEVPAALMNMGSLDHEDYDPDLTEEDGSPA